MHQTPCIKTLHTSSSLSHTAMDLSLLIISLSLFIFSLIYFIFSSKTKNSKLPPGPISIPILGSLLWLTNSLSNLETLLKTLFQKHGPVITIRLGSLPFIFVLDRRITHKALIEHGAKFSDRPAPNPVLNFFSSNQHIISSAAYGPLWRLLRRNLISEILTASRIKIYGEGRDWVLTVLINDLYDKSRSASDDGGVVAKDSLQFAMFCLLVLMCFGEKLDQKSIKEIEKSQRDLLLYGQNLSVFAFCPRAAKYLFYKRLQTAMAMKQRLTELYLPLIKARREHKEKKRVDEERFVYSYVDSILDIKLPDEEGRNLTEDEMVSLCSEFLNGGTDTTSTALQWIMAELVKHQDVQKKLMEEIESTVERNAKRVQEEDLQKMPYLKAVVLEGLRRHPPGHFVLAHTVTEDVEIDGYIIPKNVPVNFMVAEMGWDEKVWEDPMEFRPERFLKGGDGEGVDITGSREIRMMPFGVGRRICPGLGLAMLHLEYFLANLVREFEWTAAKGYEIDLSEKNEFTVVMKNPLRARLIPRGE